MANQEHLDLLTKQRVPTWNVWRLKYPQIQPDLSGATIDLTNLNSVDLHEANLSKANLHGVPLIGADLRGVNLSGATIIESDLSDANLTRANLNRIKLIGVNLSRATLTLADLSEASLMLFNYAPTNLSGADLYMANLEAACLNETNLREANLIQTNLTGTILTRVILSQSNLTGTTMQKTIFASMDLREVEGLDAVHHYGPSTIGIDTIIASHGNIPEVFLRQAGIPQSIIEQIPTLIGSLSPIDYYSCFISYSSKDEDFAKRLYADLQANGVRCWFAPHDIRIGDEFRSRIDESIRIHDKLLLILSESSVKSQWVKKEVETAFEKERRRKKLVLFPIKLDETVTRTRQAWAADIRRMRHIGNFTHWKNHDDYQKAFERLLRDLQASS